MRVIRRNLWPLVLAGLLMLAASLLLFRWPPLSIRQDVHDGAVVEVASGRPVTQTILSRHPGLTAFSIQLVEPRPPDDQVINLQLQPLNRAATVLRVLTARLGDLRTGNELQWEFTPLADSTDREYCLIIESVSGAPVGLAAHSGNMYPEGASANGGDLVFEARYQSEFGLTWSTLLTRLADEKPGLAGEPVWYVVLFAAYGLILVGFFVSLARRVSSD
jgi:hypothetical protein